MAKQPTNKPTSRDASRRRSRKTRQQREADEKKAVKDNLRNLIEAEVAKQEKFRFLRREDIRMVLGVGNFDDYERELESNFALSTPKSTEPVKEDKSPKPKLKIISKRKRRNKGK